ncbi:MAG: DEAD/DEAH box helicase family protein [Clostridium sp.]|nr:DEAD/DEAH box helicase family protein [Clostridium sp.]
MTKYVKISVLARETAKKVCRGREQWIRYLDVASRLYKYPFEDQLLIYAQRPDATACASLEMWNERMFCWINRGAKGIALIDGESERPKLRYVFDVSDVHKARRIGKDPFIWHLREEHKEVVLAELEHIYGSTNDSLPFENRIYEIAERIAEDFYEEAVDEVIDEAANSFLEDLDGDAVAVRVREMLVQSVSYTILKRCGCDMTEFADDFTFDYIHEFNTLRTLSVLGSTTSELCEPVLIRIGRTIARYDRALLQNRTYTGNHNHTERAVAGHESDIRKERGLSDSQSDTFGAGRNNADEIRSVAEELSEKPQEGDLHGTSSERRTDDTLHGDTGTGRGEVRGVDTEVDEEPDHDGGTETERSAAMDERDEPDLSAGGGDRSEGTGLSVAELEQNEPPADSPYRQMDLFSLMSEQVGNIAMAQAEMPSDRFLFGTITAEQIEEILRTGGGKENSRKRIYHKYQIGKTPEEMTAFLQKEYGETGKGFQFGGEQISVWFNQDGMYAAHGTSAFEHTEVHLSWSAVESVIRGQIEAGSYIDSKEAYLADQFVRKELADMLFFYFRDSVGTFPEELGISGYNYPGEHEYIVDMLTQEDEVRKVIAQMDRTIQRVEKGELEYRFRLAKDPQELRDDLADLLNERVEFPLPEDINVVTEDFITADEIDHTLSKGPGFVHGSFRIYDFYHQDHTLKETADFLKNEYGTGGSSHALAGSDHSYKDHDAKGIKLSKGSIFTPDVEVLLSWQVVAKRIGKLIKEDRYLTPAAKEKYIQYKQEQKEKALQQAKEELDEVIGEPEVLLENNVSEDISAENYVISDMELGVGTAKEKFQRNVEAIRTLETIESEKRPATNEEQEVLSKYVGWGGLADAFDETKSAWAKEYAELKTLLSEEEYISARESTLNAHYTSPVIIQEIYLTLQRMGFTKGNLLEPSMGIGNFFGMLPETMRESHLYGVELDSLTGRIARLLYPKANITVDGYEKTTFPNDFFDAAVGNVPFGQYKVADKKYDKYNFLIHDYFFGKTLDQVRPGGVIAFITSKGTMDKENPKVRKYIAQRAELLGAVRLPNTAFKANAGTEVTSDILFLQKRDRIVDIEPGWVHLSQDENGIAMNSYFVEHPEMVVGSMEMVSGPYGMESTCVPDDSLPFEEQLQKSLSFIEGSYEEIELEELNEELIAEVIPAVPEVKNFSYALIDDRLYYRENSLMRPVEASEGMLERIKGMVAIRDCTRELIRLQLEDYPDEQIHSRQKQLNDLYDSFAKDYGRIFSKTNKRAFHQDSSYCLLCSLEKQDEEGNFLGKADMFTKRTIKKAEVVTSVDTASEALAVSLAEKAAIDFEYMSELSGKDEDTLIEELTGIIFKNPLSEEWETADAYLSGNVRNKLETAETFAKNEPMYAVNVEALKRVQPRELDASEIEVRIGATWIEPRFIEDFMREVFETPEHLLNRDVIKIQYSDVTGQWNVKGKNADYGNSLVNMTYGTSRRNAYQILEDSLNLKDSRVYDTVIEDGKEKRVLNKKETTIAAQKQDAMRETFRDWVFRDMDRRNELVSKYNVLFNSTRPREYDGSHLKFPGMTPDIELKDYQKNAVAHVLYGNNTLLAHCVGAGKTFEMVAAAMESKRLGLCQKSLFVVPNHLTEQWASDFLRLYPGANILAATKKDFQPANRKKFCSRIATGDYDAVIIGHSQFEKIPLSAERQTAIIERQIAEITQSIEEIKAEQGERYTIKQMEKMRKTLQTRLDKLNDTSRKDDVVTFEQLGVDRLFVDESHYYKNLFLHTKMRNVAGIAQSEAQKSSDMFAKCQYLDELTGGKGITFATGTPISNSMTELYTNMRYLQYDTLQRMGLGHFDSWASSFGETQTAIELAPEGTGYRAKTRFAKFYNLPELIALFKECADIQTPDMLNLPIPKAEYENVVLQPSEHQKEMVASLAERAEAVRDRRVEPYEDNMLKITNDGRKLALDQRLINPLLPDEEQSKVNALVQKAYEIWDRTKADKSAQLIFCDLSTPKIVGKTTAADGDDMLEAEVFDDVYHDIKRKLVNRGVPEEEIAFIHEANTELRKTELFGKVRSGQVRFLIGSTQKMGAGTNVQDRLVALHHLDVPWRPSDIEQQEGRILRQGNRNDTVSIFRYVTEGTFDSYSWQVIENKQKFISQIMTSKSPVRSCEDVDEAALTYAEVKALATGNPYIKEKMDLDIQVSRLKLMKANHTSQIYRLEDNIAKNYPKQIEVLQERIRGFQTDMETVRKNLPADKDNFSMKVGNRVFTDKKEAGTAILAMCQEMDSLQQMVEIGEYAGMRMKVTFDSFNRKFVMSLKGELSHNFELGSDAFGNITRLHNVLDGMAGELSEAETKLNNVTHQLETAKMEVQKPFPAEEELKEKMERLAELDALLNMDEKGETPVLENEPTVTPLGEWLLEHLLPEFMEEYEMTEERAREVLLDALPEEESEVVCFSSEQNAESLDSEEMQKQMSEYMDGDFYAIPVSDTEYLIVPKVEQDSVIYLRSILSQLGDSVLSSPAMKSHAAYEYDSGTNRMKPFDHMRILRGLCAVGEEKHIYHVKSREPTETRTSNLAQVH